MGEEDPTAGASLRQGGEQGGNALPPCLVHFGRDGTSLHIMQTRAQWLSRPIEALRRWGARGETAQHGTVGPCHTDGAAEAACATTGTRHKSNSAAVQ